ncbi:eukaryotic translation initiation factor 4 gamma 3 isoform X1 [Dendroctonus ponderosae]|uniref:eukaryotic translation initiation factor 4 gamma 3 isoform X1 n=1 Tax=Dendroctonus ponderosae TaxID=77166 RepID=UPI002035C4E0|nr:eukaryotic translation initiation factor 4 gamma 3 isoform X1 [Dendroctonus ponderosae]
MSTNQKQPATGGPQTQRYSNSPYQPILPQHAAIDYTGSDGSFHSQGAPYVNQAPGPNQGPGLRGLPPTGHPNQSSTPPTQELKVPGLPGQIPQMQFVQGPVRTAPAPFYQSRGTAGPHAQPQRMPNQQHRAQGPAQIYQQQYQVVQPLFIQQNTPLYYNNARHPNNLMAQPPYQTQVYPQPLAYPAFPPPVAAAGPSTYSSLTYQPLAYQPASNSMPIPRPAGNAVAATAPNAASGNISVGSQPGPIHNSYSRANNSQKRRPFALSIIDPSTGQDRLDEIFENASHPASEDSSARQTPQPAPVLNHHKEIQAAFAKQVAQAIDADGPPRASVDTPIALETPTVIQEPPSEQFNPQPVVAPSMFGIKLSATTKFDVESSNLQYDAKEFVSTASMPFKEPTPIVSANSEAAEVILTKAKDRESPVKSRKQGPREPKPDLEQILENSKSLNQEDEPKDLECNKIYSIVQEDIASTPESSAANTQPVVEDPIASEDKEQTVFVGGLNDQKNASKNPAVVEPKSPELEVQPTSVPAEAAASGNGKSKHFRNKQIQNGKAHAAPAPPAAPVQVPVPQPPKSNNKSSKTKDINLKGANKEGTDMDAFNENNDQLHLAEVNSDAKTDNGSNVNLSNDKLQKFKSEKEAEKVPPTAVKTDQIIDLVNANPIQQTGPPKVVPKPSVETDEKEFRPCLQNEKDANENVTIKVESQVSQNAPLSAPATAPAPAPAPVAAPVPAGLFSSVGTQQLNKPSGLLATSKPSANKVFDVTSIIKDVPKPPMIFPIGDKKDEARLSAIRTADGGRGATINPMIDNYGSLKTDSSSLIPKIVYKPGQWAPNHLDGLKVYDREFLWSIKSLPASNVKPDDLPDYILSDERNRQIDSRLSMPSRSDHMPSFNNYVGKSGSQRGTVNKRGSQSGKMGSRGGDKIGMGGKPGPKVSISLRGDVKLNQSENAWKPTRLNKVGDATSEEDIKTTALMKKFRSILNKLTPQRFATLVRQVTELDIDTKDRMKGVINLTFEKAVDEPNFARSYAMLCSEIQNMHVVSDQKAVVFRGVLINRCQLEFEKHTIDEKIRNAKVEEIDQTTDLEKKKELEFELEEYDRRLRMKSVGTMRFIGELFKQSMLTVNIMRRCLESLLSHKSEESLECLCKLLSTIGKELEASSCSLIDIINEMKKIADGKRQQISSRIRFMLQDVIELRDSKWVPRRGDTNPKTIDQIQREAEKEQMNIQVINNSNPPRRDDRGGSMRSDRGGNRSKMSDEGWSSVTKGNRSFTIQPSKMRAPKLSTDERLGSSHMFGAFVKGAGSSTGSQFNSNFGGNRYDVLQHNTDWMDKQSLQSRNKDPYPGSKGSSMERNTYKGVYEGRGSQQRDSNIPVWGMGPPNPAPPVAASAAPQPAPAAPLAPAPVITLEVDEEFFREHLKVAIDEALSVSCTSLEFYEDVKRHCLPKDYPNVIYQCYNYTLEISLACRMKTGELMATLISAGKMTLEDFFKGFGELLGLWEDLIIDVPQIWQYLAEDLVCLVLREVLTIQSLKKLLEILIERNVSIKLLKPLFALVVKEKGPNFLHKIFLQSGLKLSDFMQESDVGPFVQQNNLEFLIGGGAPVGESIISSDAIKNKLAEFFQRKASFDEIVNWISANVGDHVKDFEFTRALAGAIFEDSIPKNKLQPEVLTGHGKLLQKYVDNDTTYELQCLYVLQSLVHKLEHPSGLLLSICDKLYEDSTFCQESFIAWEKSTDPAEQEGKGVALKQLTSFFTRLKENEEDDDSSSHSEDA